jgi:hypothetical protein
VQIAKAVTRSSQLIGQFGHVTAFAVYANYKQPALRALDE